ncbi:ABC transporter substrate-binding protein [Thalassolituus sp. LLYu03]|uniref:ABC transporter substrate-binding protein n=1 Tax=Thalassolituus sp. LLYu03 TaxID=3421656 RepID=UPI003D283658
MSRILLLLSAFTAFLMAQPAAAEPEFINPQPLAERIKTPVGPVKLTSPMRVPIITWGGDMVTILANGGAVRTQKGSDMAAAGLDVELVRQDNFDQQLQDYLSGASPYLRCTVGMCNQALDLLDKDPRTRPVIIYQLTWSRGGDTLVAKDGIMKVNQLKGRTLAVQAYGPHVDFMTTLLQQAGLTMSDVNIKWMADLTLSPNSPPEALKDPSIDAAFMIISDAYGITSGRRVGTGENDSIAGARMIISTMFARRIIADVYAVRSDYFEQHRDDVQKFAQVLMHNNAKLQTLMKDLDNPQKLKLLEQSADILLGDKAAQPDIENLFYDAQFVDRHGNIEFLASKDFQHRLDVLNGRVQDAFNDIGLIRTHSPIKAADWNFDQFSE